MVKAVFIDFYGTLVHEDGAVIAKISQKIFETGVVEKISHIGAFWWNEFQTSFLKAYGENFIPQRVLEYNSLKKTIEHFNSTADADALSRMMFEHWVNPPIFEESKRFFGICPVPIYIVSNIDRNDVLKAISFHNLKPTGVFTSEDAKSYKPRKELFEFALNVTKLTPSEVVHIGDSLSSDIKGASELGIKTLWINRSKKEIPGGVISIETLLEALDTCFFK